MNTSAVVHTEAAARQIPQTLTVWLLTQDELKYWESYTKGGYVAGSEFTLAGELAICYT